MLGIYTYAYIIHKNHTEFHILLPRTVQSPRVASVGDMQRAVRPWALTISCFIRPLLPVEHLATHPGFSKMGNCDYSCTYHHRPICVPIEGDVPHYHGTTLNFLFL